MTLTGECDRDERFRPTRWNGNKSVELVMPTRLLEHQQHSNEQFCPNTTW